MAQQPQKKRNRDEYGLRVPEQYYVEDGVPTPNNKGHVIPPGSLLKVSSGSGNDYGGKYPSTLVAAVPGVDYVATGSGGGGTTIANTTNAPGDVQLVVVPGSGSAYQVKTLKQGPNISLTDVGGVVTITGTDADQVLNIDNASAGTGQGLVLKNVSAGTAHLKKVKQGNKVVVTDGTDDITVAVQANAFVSAVDDASVPGANEYSLQAGITGETLKVKKIIQGANILLSSNATSVTVAAPAPVVATGENIVAATGTGLVYRDNTGAVLNFRKVKEGINTKVATTGDDVVVDSFTLLNGTGDAQLVDTFNSGSRQYPIRALSGTASQIVVVQAPTPNEFVTFSTADNVVGALVSDGVTDGSGTSFTIIGNPLPASRTAHFRGIKAGTNVSLINSTPQDIVIDVASGAVASGQNIPAATGAGLVYKNNTGAQLNFRKILGLTNIDVSTNLGTDDIEVKGFTLTPFGTGGLFDARLVGNFATANYNIANLKGTTNQIVIAQTGNTAGELVTFTTADNVVGALHCDGVASGFVSIIVGSDTPSGRTAHFKGIKAGNNVSLAASTSTDIIIDVPTAAGLSLVNTGSGTSTGPSPPKNLFFLSSLTGGVLTMKGLKPGVGISLADTNSNTDVTITGPVLSVVGSGFSIFADPLQPPYSFRGFTQGTNITFDNTANQTDFKINAFTLDGNGFGDVNLVGILGSIAPRSYPISNLKGTTGQIVLSQAGPTAGGLVTFTTADNVVGALVSDGQTNVPPGSGTSFSIVGNPVPASRTAHFRGFKAGTNVSLAASNATDVVIDVTTGAGLQLNNLGTVTLASLAAGTLSVKGLVATGSGIGIDGASDSNNIIIQKSASPVNLQWQYPPDPTNTATFSYDYGGRLGALFPQALDRKINTLSFPVPPDYFSGAPFVGVGTTLYFNCLYTGTTTSGTTLSLIVTASLDSDASWAGTTKTINFPVTGINTNTLFTISQQFSYTDLAGSNGLVVAGTTGFIRIRRNGTDNFPRDLVLVGVSAKLT